jgi:uncharacterized membrane protein
MGALRKYFITGLATILPVGATVFIFWFLISRLGAILRPWLQRVPGLAGLPGLLTTLIGFVVLVGLIVAVGALASGLFGRWVVGWLDRFFRRVPLVKGIYGSARQLTEAVFVKRSSLRKTVLAEYPRRGILAVGFLTSDERFPLADGRHGQFVFFPTTPNPTSGWLALIPEDEITETRMSIDEGLRLAVSGGVVRPDEFAGLVRQARMGDDAPAY